MFYFGSALGSRAHLCEIRCIRVAYTRMKRPYLDMAYKLSVLAVLSAVLLIACEGDTQSIEPEVDHCATVAGRATQIYGKITVIDTRHWEMENIRRVQLRFEYPPGHETFQTGYIICAYDFGLDRRADPDRIPMAKAVYFKGRYLSENELEFLNKSLFRPHPKFKTIR